VKTNVRLLRLTRRQAPGVIRRLVVLSTLVLLCDTVVAQDSNKPDPPTDAELLEFLGSVDSGGDSQATADDGSWIEYLAQTDIGKIAKTADQNGASGKTATGEQQPPASGDKKDE
jgi:hypothetical protein